MLGGIPRRWVHVCIAKRNLLDISEIHAAGFPFINDLEASFCIQHAEVYILYFRTDEHRF